MKITIGANQFYWNRNDTFDFYHQLLSAPVDRVYLGETICPKRKELRYDDWLDIARQLSEKGKEIVLSSLTLLESESDFRQVRQICANEQYLVEANDIAAVQIASELNKNFILGPAINIYSSATLDFLVRQGAVTWVPPVEIGYQQIDTIYSQALTSVDLEIFAYGYLPLAYSARCYSARHHQFQKDQCQKICMEYPDGIQIFSQDGEPVFNLNGISTQSGKIAQLITEIPRMELMNVDYVRLSPVKNGFFETIKRYHKALTGQPDPMIPIARTGCNGYWFEEAGKEWV
ncbi:U32 family peptidase [Gynuella sp.]|uniref:U32 family peptidase n=1 Tax=Gynuella sp. TaxID=2969146 RepID=UPI003D11B73B